MPVPHNYFYTDAETSVVKDEHLERIETVPDNSGSDFAAHLFHDTCQIS